MTPRPNQMLSHYRLVEKIGEGGMGVVWKADDTTLDREVAIKVLPEAFAEDTERLARFEREAKLLASLNHPNIATVHGLHDADGVRFLAMELVNGENLAERLVRGPLPADEAVAVARQVAEALEAAHEHGIIHRDLKPANIQLAAEGQVKVLDFGLAKALSPEASGDTGSSLSPTLTSAGTVAGVLLGTAAYMSPEQARAKAVDRRTDVWAFGCVLYEMLTGRKAFGGESLSDTLAAILKEAPDWSALRGADSRALQPLMERCLRKDPKRRLHHLADVRIGLEEAAEGTATAAPSSAMPRWGLLAIAGLALIAVVLAYLWLAAPTGSGVSGGAVRLKLSQQTFYAGVESFPSLSPDGSFLAYAAAPDGGALDIFIERVGGSRPINLTADSDETDLMPAFSPDGRSIAFRSERGGGGIFVMGATGESVKRLTDSGFDPAWSPDGKQLLFVEEGSFNPLGRNVLSPLWIVDVETGEKRKLYEPDSMQPSWSPNGHRIACWTAYFATGASGQRDIFTIRADGTDRVDVTNDIDVDWNPVWSGDGRHLYFASDRGGSMNLWRVPIDERTGRLLREPEPVPTPSRWSGPIALSGTGLLAFVAVEGRSNVSRVPFDSATGAITGPPEAVTSGTLPVVFPQVSPDGEWLVFNTWREVQEDIYLVRIDGTGLRKLTDDRHRDRGPSWTPDGEGIVFYSNRGGRYEYWTIRRDGSELRQLTETEGTSIWRPKISPNGRLLAGVNTEATWLFELGGGELFGKDDGTRLPPVGEDEGVFFGIHWSPDSRYLAGVVQLQRYAAIYDVDTGDYRVLEGPEASGANNFEGWLPDGRAVVTEGEKRFVVDFDAGSWTPVPDPPVPLEASSLSPGPDGRFLYYIVSSDEADIWIAEIE